MTVVFLFEGCGVSIIPLLFWCPRGFAGSYVVVHPSFSSSFSSKSSVFGVVVHASRRPLVSFFFFSADKFLGTTPTEMDWTMGFCDPDVDDDVFTHASASALDEKLFCVVIEKVE